MLLTQLVLEGEGRQLSYSSFRGVAPKVTLVRSPEESHASGLHVGRLNLWPAGVLSGSSVTEMVMHSPFDYVILRYPSQDEALAASLLCDELIHWQADTLIYFEGQGHSQRQIVRPHNLKTLSSADATVSDRLTYDIFCGYRNHYSSSPQFKDLDVAEAYQSWVRHELRSASTAVFHMTGAAGEDLGLAMVDGSPHDHDEVLLAGIVPDQRRTGWYSELLRHLSDRAQQRGKSFLAISTQSSNTQVMSAWCRLGWEPTLSLSTVHIMRRRAVP